MTQLERISPWPFTGLGILACTFFLNGGSLIFMDWWLVLALYLFWIPVAMKAGDAFARRPKAVFPLAMLTLGAYVVAVGLQALTR